MNRVDASNLCRLIIFFKPFWTLGEIKIRLTSYLRVGILIIDLIDLSRVCELYRRYETLILLNMYIGITA